MRLSEPIQPRIVTAPLAGAASEPPDYRQKVPIVYYRPGEWKRELISDALEGVLHGIFVTGWDQDGRDELLTASFLGIHLFRRRKDGTWTQTELTKGSPQPWPKCGASDVAAGRLGRLRFLCAIEPWPWQRQVIDDTLANGHTIHAAGLNGDGRDEINGGGRPDIACIGATTLKWYENLGGRGSR